MLKVSIVRNAFWLESARWEGIAAEEKWLGIYSCEGFPLWRGALSRRKYTASGRIWSKCRTEDENGRKSIVGTKESERAYDFVLLNLMTRPSPGSLLTCRLAISPRKKQIFWKSNCSTANRTCALISICLDEVKSTKAARRSKTT